MLDMKLLTLEELQSLPKEMMVFRTGVAILESDGGELREAIWGAFLQDDCCGWAIYHTMHSLVKVPPVIISEKGEIAVEHPDWRVVRSHGRKLEDPDLIRRMVPCTDEAWYRYRLLNGFLWKK